MSTILVVEDERLVRENIQEILISHDYDCITAPNGLEAIEILSHKKIDLIISDIMMPKMNGLDFFKNLMEREQSWHVPFIFLTAKSDDKSVREAMKLGAEDYIKKPFRLNEIIDAVEVRIRKSENSKNRIERIKENISKYVPHELRTPLGIVLGYSNLILEDQDTMDKEEIIEMVEWIQKSGFRLKDRIEKLILLTEIELDIDSDSALNSTSLVDPLIVSDISLGTLGYHSRSTDIMFEIETSELKIPINYLDRALHEIIDNSCKFSENGTSIVVTGLIEKDMYKFSVKDSGRGMDYQEIQNLLSFEQFSREYLQQEGNGLGLQIVNRIKDYVHGELDIASKKHVGTEVVFAVPLKRNNISH